MQGPCKEESDMKLRRFSSFLRKPVIWGACGMLTVALAAPLPAAEEVNTAGVFGGAKIEEVYRIALNKGDLLLESILAAIEKHGIKDGALLTAAGSLEECTFHGVSSRAGTTEQWLTTKKGGMEILNINGLIADGEAHFHMTLSNEQGAFGGHLEEGCRVLNRAELTIAKFSGPPLARKPNAAGGRALAPK
jgi:hypothetical protein